MLAGTGAVACSCDIIGNVLDTVADIFNDVANRVAGIVVFGGLCLVCHIVIVHVTVVLSAGREDTDIKYHNLEKKEGTQAWNSGPVLIFMMEK